jgi:hypothetical protein
MKKLLGILVFSLLWCNVGFADAASVKKTCSELGLKPGTELFLDCALRLMSQEKKDDSSKDKKSFFKKRKKSAPGESFNEKYNSLADIFKKMTEEK